MEEGVLDVTQKPKRRSKIIAVLGPGEPELQEFNPKYSGFFTVAVGPQADMEELGAEFKIKNPQFSYRIIDMMSFVTWVSG